MKARQVWERFDQQPRFQPNLDDWLDRVESDTGIDFMEEVYPWLGPEIGVGVVDVVGSAVAIDAGGALLVVVLVGTTDPALAQKFLEDWVAYQEREEGLSFDTETYRELTVITESSGLQHYAVSDPYLVFSTDPDLLRDTIDRILDGGGGESLYTSSGFKEVRQTLPNERFLSGYADVENIWKDIRRQFGAQIPDQMRQRLEEVVPDWTAVAGSFLNNGMRLELSAPAGQEEQEMTLGPTSLAAAKLLPSDALAFLSFKVRPDMAPVRDELSGQKIADLGPDFSSALPLLLDTEFDQQSSLEELLDILLVRFSDTVGLDLEQDLLDWMTGEFSFALLPTDFKAVSEDPASAAINVAGILQFDPSKRDKLYHALDVFQTCWKNVSSYLQSRSPLEPGKRWCLTLGESPERTPIGPVTKSLAIT